MTQLRIAANLSLPTEAVTQTFGVLAKRGVGKTYTASVLAEEMLKAHLQVVVADPIGVWHGLRSSADGKKSGLPIYVFGGESRVRDLPLEVAGGELVADVIVDQRISVVLDLSLFRKGEQVRFMTDFSERLYHRNREALHLFLDEADAFAPQKPPKGAERLLGAVEDLVRRGRARGIGVTLITQRSAVLNKDVLTQIEVLVALRTISPQDRAAIDAWVQVHGTPEQREQLMGSLPALPVGTAWFWSPGWPTEQGIFERVKVRTRETFDSSRTPKSGERRIQPKAYASVDLDALRTKMAASIEKAKADDPRELKATIATLRREIAGLQKATAPTTLQVKTIEKRILTASDRKAITKLIASAKEASATTSAIASLMGKIELHANTWSAHAEVLESALSAAAATSGDVTVAAVRAGATRSRRDYGSSGGRAEQSTEREVRGETSPSPSPARTSDGTGGAPKRYLQKILDALASLEAIGYARATNLQVATWSKMSVRGGAFGGYVRELVAARMVERDGTDRAGQLWLTPAGRDASRAHDLATSDLHAMAHAVAKGYLHKVLDPLLEVYPVELSLQDLALRAGMSIEGGAFMGYVRELRALGFVVSTKDTARAADALFLEAVR